MYESELNALTDRGEFRTLDPLAHVGGKIVDKGETLLNFSSNDYLNLASHPEVKQAAMAAVEEFGCGATASRLMAGDLAIHEALEAELAEFTGQEAALIFGTGFQTNLGVLTSLSGPQDVVFSDALNHASLIDGCRLSKARVEIYRHGDAGHLEDLIRRTPCDGRRLIVIESIFSMDGDCAPLAELSEIARRYGAIFVVDESHGFGVFGKGAGLSAEVANSRPDVLIGTLSKALGSFGGFVAARREIRDLVVNRARSFIYSTGLPPASVAAARKSLDLVRRDPSMGASLLERACRFRTSLSERDVSAVETSSQIVPLIVGENEAALELSRTLRSRGIISTAVRPPTVPPGTSRLRFSITLAHTDADLERTAGFLAECLHEAGAV